MSVTDGLASVLWIAILLVVIACIVLAFREDAAASRRGDADDR